MWRQDLFPSDFYVFPSAGHLDTDAMTDLRRTRGART